MYSPFIVIGTIGAICFALSGMPQAIKSIRDGHSKGIAEATVWLWLLGEVGSLVYTLKFYSTDLILLFNYISNTILVSIIFAYRYWPRK
jgi:uncharacterized protein with PQ loop repeat